MNQQKSNDIELLTELYKNMKMGADSIINISPKVNEGKFRDELARELDAYESYSKKMGKIIYEAGNEPKEGNPVSKIASKVGVAMNTLTDTSTSHLAKLMIEGATMGITENTTLINRYKKKGISDNVRSLAEDSVKFMETSVETLKTFL